MSVYDYSLKVLVVGESCVGKTSICTRLAGHPIPFDIAPTIGVEFSSCSVKADDGARIKCQIWDLAGGHLYRDMIQGYYREVAVAIVVFDLSSLRTFKEVPYWLSQLVCQRTGKPPLAVLLVGNKVDKRRQVSQEDARAFAKERGLVYYEMSAKNGDPLRQFSTFVREVVQSSSGAEQHPGLKCFPHRDPYAALETKLCPRTESIRLRYCWTWLCPVL